eukprot:TRINITY_DN11275_c0_g1_i1.p1 TRINITY_DN11275_c0_g1~~TRINITY_DN11275_c0_g1_i1.p1  ORF type:complete len:298 (-),score=59.49 TRINITY_DN11275_c0_g1_i1:49-942(-)
MGNSAVVNCKQKPDIADDGTPRPRVYSVNREAKPQGFSFGLTTACCQAKVTRGMSDIGDLDDPLACAAFPVQSVPALSEEKVLHHEGDEKRERIDEEEWQNMLRNMKNLTDRLVESHAPVATIAEGDESDSSSEGEPRAKDEKEEKVEVQEDPQVTLEQERENALEAIAKGRPFYTIPQHLRNDKELVLSAIGSEGAYCFDYITSQELKTQDRDVVLALMFADGTLLQTVSEELRGDREVVRAAVSTFADALKFASKELRGDKSIQALAASRGREESRLMKIFQAKCGPSISSCMGR